MTSADHVCLLCMRETALPHQYPCPFCGGDDRTLTLQSPALPSRTVLDGRYVVGRTLGQGGFGITYQAYDLRMGNAVAIKEYYPSSLVNRDSSVSTAVTVNAIKGTRAREEYSSGLRHFLYEARRQAKLASSPGVVSVTDFFECNNTAYYVMEYVDGCTLVKYLHRPLPMQEVLALLDPIADSLISIHAAGLIHRDISPDNIMCAKSGHRKLLDFGASHSFAEEESTTGNATLKHGFAPPEQYGSSSMQGPWTDIYAFAATIYWCLTGKIPQDSMDRSIGGDRLAPPSQLGAIISQEAEAVLMRGMALPVTARYQDMSTFWGKLKKAAVKDAPRTPYTSPSSFPLSDGKTIVVPSVAIEEPEHTKIPELTMEQMEQSLRALLQASAAASQAQEKPETTGSFAPQTPGGVQDESVMETPEPTLRSEDFPVSRHKLPVSSAPEEAPVPPPEQEFPPLEGPDITVYRPKVEQPAASDPVPSQKSESPAPSASMSPSKPDNRVLAALIGIIVVLLLAVAYMAFFSQLHGSSQNGDSSTVISQSEVSIAGTVYSTDITELHLTADPSYVSRYKADVAFVSIDYLSASDWRSICQLSNLRKLSLVGCSLSSLAGLEALTELEVLDVSDNDLTSLSPISGLPSLAELYAAGNALTDCSDLSELTGLVYLDLSSNQLEDLSALTGMKRLRTLYVQRNTISDLAPLSGLTELTTLDVANNQVEALNELYALKKLTMLYVDGNCLTNSHLSALLEEIPDCALDVEVLTDIPTVVKIGGESYSTSLNNLYLDNAGLQDGDLENLKYMVNLTSLVLSNNNLTDLTQVSRLYGLTSLDISHNNISDLTPILGLRNLTSLYLSGNQLSDLEDVTTFRKLKHLTFSDNQIRDLSLLRELPDLETLAICGFRADSLEPLYDLSKLYELTVSSGSYTDEELSALRAALPNCTVKKQG